MHPSTSRMPRRNREDTNMDNEELENLKDFMGRVYLTMDDIQLDLEDGGMEKAGRIVADAQASLEKAIDLMDKQILKRTTKVTRSR